MSIDTVNDIEPRRQYVAAAAQTEFDYPFPIFDDNGITVDVDGVTLALTDDYTVSGAGDDTGGTVTLLSPLVGGEIVTLYRETPIERDTDFQQGGPFFAASVNNDFDKLTIIAQELAAKYRRTLHVDETDTVSDLSLPDVEARKGKLLGFSTGTGAPEAVVSIGTTPLSRSIIGDLLYDRTDLEVSNGFVPTDTSYPPGHVRRAGIEFDGSDEASKLQALINFCGASGVPIIGDVGTVVIGSTVVVNCTGDLSMMTVSADSSAFTPALRVGTITGGPLQLNGRLLMPKLINSDKPGTGWSGQQVGLWLANLYHSEIYVPYIRGFNVGLDCGGISSGFSYNSIYLGEIFDNKITVRLQGKHPTAGWANQNTFWGGRCWVDSGEGTAISGARFVQLVPYDTATSAGTSWPNGNTFVGTTFESDEPEYQAEISGNNNIFLNCRWEAASPAILLTGHASGTDTYENMIIGGYNSSEIAFTSTGIVRYSAVINSRSSSIGGSGVTLNLHNRTASDSPLIQGFEAASEFLGKTAAATDWAVRLSATALQGKASGDVAPQVDINFPNGIGTLRRLQLTSAAFAASSGVVMMGNSTQTTVGAAGGATALPATPTGYLRFFIGTTEYVLPYYARA